MKICDCGGTFENSSGMIVGQGYLFSIITICVIVIIDWSDVVAVRKLLLFICFFVPIIQIWICTFVMSGRFAGRPTRQLTELTMSSYRCFIHALL
jgi:hypothetical protein